MNNGIHTTRGSYGKPVAITEASIIAEITDAANWNLDGEYTGSVAGLILGNYYDDISNKTKYQFNGTTVIRWPINTIVAL